VTLQSFDPATFLAAVDPALTFTRRLDAGGMATVLLAHDHRLGRDVAVKVLAGVEVGPRAAERFAREVGILAALHHPNIVPVFTAGMLDGTPWYLMPYLPGRSLRARLLVGPAPSTAEIRRVLRDVARACAFAHAHGVVHRDLKPENILLAGDAAVVIDFGIARAIDGTDEVAPEGASLTRDGHVIGTPAYMSPEQAAGDRQIDHRADIYALGVIGYELLTGRPPFEGSTAEILRGHVLDTPPPIPAAMGTVAPSLSDLIMRCLAKRPTERPEDAKAVLAALEEGGSGESIQRMDPVRRRLPGSVVASAVAIAGLLAVATIVPGLLPVRQPEEAPQQRRGTDQPAVVVLPLLATGDPEVQSVVDDLVAEFDLAMRRAGLGASTSRLAVDRVGRRAMPLRDIADSLGATVLVDGSVRLANGTVRVVLEATMPHVPATVWATIQRDTVSNVAELATALAASLAESLRRWQDSTSAGPRGP
jgi:eukaryotic-like serine/threonine-protein kinase